MKSIALFKQSLFMMLFSALAFTSCQTEDSADVNQDKIYTDYELFYNSNTDKTQAVARFRFGGPLGTLLELNDPASVKFDGEEVPFNALYSGHFKEFSGQVLEGTFLYTNVDGETFENTVPVFESIDFPSGIDTVSKSAPYAINWDGTALKADQNVGVFVGSWTWGQDALFIESALNAESIELGTNGLSNVQEGNTTFYMDRHTEVDVSQGTEKGGLIRGKYRAANIEVIVTQ